MEKYIADAFCWYYERSVREKEKYMQIGSTLDEQLEGGDNFKEDFQYKSSGNFETRRKNKHFSTNKQQNAPFASHCSKK